MAFTKSSGSHSCKHTHPFPPVCMVLGNICHTESADLWNSWAGQQFLIHSPLSLWWHIFPFTAWLKYVSHIIKFTHWKGKRRWFFIICRQILTSIEQKIKDTCSLPHLGLLSYSVFVGTLSNQGCLQPPGGWQAWEGAWPRAVG